MGTTVNQMGRQQRRLDKKETTTNKLDFTQDTQRDYSGLDSFKILVCMEGSAEIGYEGGTETIAKGDAFLIPASIQSLALRTSEGFKMLESYVPSA